MITIIASVLIYAAMQSPDYTISREITINAPADKIFPYLNNPKLAEQWAPWNEIDPDAKMLHTGPDAGVGARTSWDAGKQLGTGSATIVQSIANQRVSIRLEYTKPMQMVQDAEYLIVPAAGQSQVTWLVRGQNTYMGRVMCIFFNMDKIVGGMFEKGLLKLKTLIESQK